MSTFAHNDTTSLVLGPHVGSLPLLHFVNIMIGCLVISICFPAVISFLKLIRRTKFPRQGKRSKAAGPLFMSRHTRSSFNLASTMRTQVSAKIQQSQITQPYSAPGENTPGPDLPIPVVRPQQGNQNEITSDEIEEWENLIRERMKVEVLITNLRRVDQARRGAGGFVHGPTQEAVARRRHLDGDIREISHRLRSRQETLNEEEGRVLDEISLLLKNRYGNIA